MSNAAWMWWYYYAGTGAAVPVDDVPDGLFDIQFLAQSSVTGGSWATGAWAFGAWEPDALAEESRIPDPHWVSLLPDIRTSEPIVLEYGIRGSDPSERIAGPGELSFALDNAAWNSQSTMGAYSPLHADRRVDFDLNVPIRLVMKQDNGVDTPTPYYKFQGKLGNVSVTPGVHEDRLVRCTVWDLMDDYSRNPVPDLPVLFGADGGYLIQAILTSLPADLQPDSMSVSSGGFYHPVAFDTFTAGTSVRAALNDVVMSDFGKLFMIGAPSFPGTRIVYSDRHYASLNPLVVATLTGTNDILPGGLDVPGSRDDIISSVDVTTHPTAPISPVEEVLWSLENSSLLIQNGQTYTSLEGPYRDPQNRQVKVGGTGMIAPAPTTDYTMNTAQDGTGTDVTASFVVTADFTSGTSVAFTAITNNSGFPAYVTFLRVRGFGVYRFDSTFHVDVDTVYGSRPLQIDMPIQSDANVGTDIAQYLGNTLSRSLPRVNTVQFYSDTISKRARAIIFEPGIRIAVDEEVTGLIDEEFTINGVRLEFIPRSSTEPLMLCTWWLEPASTQRYWLQGIAGSSEIGDTTFTGF